jgi:DnaJ-class molecular chaperone
MKMTTDRRPQTAVSAREQRSRGARERGSTRAPQHLGTPAQEGGRPTAVVICAFCSGKGKDPFGIMSHLATCQVCGGTGRRTLRQPTAPCAFCRGTGVHPGSRNTCTTCGGVGAVEIPDDAVTCPCCGGTGRAADDANYIWPDSPLSCGCCEGKGVVAPE